MADSYTNKLNSDNFNSLETEYNKAEDKTKETKEWFYPKLIPSLLYTSFFTVILMTIYEVTKQLLHPNITIWQSHLITIAFTSLVAPLSAYFAFRRIEALRQAALLEIAERKKIEKELIQARAQLEIRVEERTAQLVDKNSQLKKEIDIRREAEWNMRKSEERYKLLFELMPSIVFHFNNNLEITELNYYSTQVFKKNSEELKGFNLENVKDFRIIPAFKRALEGKDGFYEGEIIFGDNNELTFISLRTVPYYEGNGKIAGGIAMIENITERIKGQKELIEAKEFAERSDKLKTEFLAQMSHEIRTPLNTILNFSSLIEEELKEQVDDEINSNFKVIHTAGDRIIRTIDLLLNMSELQTGVYDYSPKIFDLSDCLEVLYNEQKQAATNKKLEFNFVDYSSGSTVVADDYSVSQIFNNLINNAIKYTNEGKVEINLFRNSDCKLVVDVRDTGIGISEEYKRNLFKPFSQEEQGYTRKYEGNGLGLALVKKYCELNNLKIEVESTKGKGSLFRVTFP